MPTYQYRCNECAHELEAVQKFSDAPLTECPKCLGALRKVFSAVGVVFKGSGFYATDNRSKPKSNTTAPKTDAGTSESTKAESGKSESTKSESASTVSESPKAAESPKTSAA